MGSLWETYLRQRDLRNFLRTQELTIAAQLCAVDEQLKHLLADDARSASELARSDYLHHYLVGILDAITSFYERETRRRLGLELYRQVFVRYLRERFCMGRHEADFLFARACEDLEHSGLRDGYADGLQALRGGGTPRRLLECFTGQAKSNAEACEMAALPMAVNA